MEYAVVSVASWEISCEDVEDMELAKYVAARS